MKKNIIFITLVIVLISCMSGCAAGPIYSKPEFRGRIVDAETKEPIEGAVAVVLYYKRATVSLNVGGPSSYVFEAKETLTDNKGEFYFPSFTSLMLFSEGVRVNFIFYKPGYMAISEMGIDTGIAGAIIRQETYFATDVVGKEVELDVLSQQLGKPIKWKGPLGIMELKRAITREEKLRTMPSPPTDYTSKELPILIKVINAEYNNLGIKGGYK